MHLHPKIDNAQARAFWKDYSQRLYSTPRAWAHKGENLIHAFRAVADASVPHEMHLNMQDQAFMLAGMAVEIQLKAILINSPVLRNIVSGDMPQKNDQTFKLWKRFFSHNLIGLALDANFPLTVTEQRTLIALSQYINWRGRYVVPTKSGLDDLLTIQLENGLAGQIHHILLQDVTDLLDRIVIEVNAKLYA